MATARSVSRFSWRTEALIVSGTAWRMNRTDSARSARMVTGGRIRKWSANTIRTMSMTACWTVMARASAVRPS